MNEAKAALLVMDLQTAIVDRFAGESSGGLLERLAVAITAARAASVPVIYVRVAFRDGAPEISADNLAFAPLSKSLSFAETDPQSDIHDALAPLPGDVVVTKRRVSAFTGSDLDLVLRAAGIRDLVLAGISTSGVVLSTLREAADRDFRLLVLSDGCIDADPEIHRVLIEKVFPRQARVLAIQEWVTQLS